MQIPKILSKIANRLQKESAKAIIVGGAVRDFLLNKAIKDYDIEVFGLGSLEELESILSEFGKVNLVGKSYGILKLKVGSEEFDFSLPRRERKVGAGHKGFEVSVDGFMDFKEAARRRDFTINAMGFDILNNKILDPFNGREDLKNRILRVVDKKTFIEDPLRVYRGIQFAARFDLEIEEESFKLLKEMVNSGILEELPKERIFEEFKKLLLKAKKPSKGFEIMRALGILKYYPELEALIGVEQNPKWHPEGDVWTHTMLALDKMAQMLVERDDLTQKEKLKFMLTILCHDFGKPLCTKQKEDGTLTSYGHEKLGVEPTIKFLNRLTNDVKLIESITPLVEHHLKPIIYYKNGAKDSTIRRLSTKVNISDLVLVARADNLGRTTKEALNNEFKAGDWLLKRAKDLQVDKEPPKPLIMGRDLINLGLKPSKKFKDILQKVYRAQLDGLIKDKREAIEFTKSLL